MAGIVGAIFGSKKPKINTGQREAVQQRTQLRKRREEAALKPGENIFTGSLGDTSTANVKKKKLLGG